MVGHQVTNNKNRTNEKQSLVVQTLCKNNHVKNWGKNEKNKNSKLLFKCILLGDKSLKKMGFF